MRFRPEKLGRRWTTAVAAIPLAVGLGAVVVPTSAVAQSSLPGSATDLTRTNPREGDPIRTEDQNLPGLPSGVSVEKVEWLTDRRVAVYVNSAAMQKPIKVEILLARDWYSQPNKTFPSVYALDGLRANDEESGWTAATNMVQQFADRNVNVILPIGGQSSFYTDWINKDGDVNYKWETFLTKELPPVLKKGWRANNDAAVVGLSMGGTGAMNLAERNPGMYKFVASYSGYLDTSSPGMPQAIGFATRDVSNLNAENMWGSYGSQGWVDHDPKTGIASLKGTSVYVSAGSGSAGAFDQQSAIPGMPTNTAGYGLEVLSRMTTETFVSRAQAQGIPVTAEFRPSGTHSWPYWQFELNNSWPQMADALGLAKSDRGADCTPVGAIAAAWPRVQNQVGTCTSNEYEGENGGKIEDFRAGQAFWSPATGAHFLWGRIGAHYAEMGATKSFLGYPTSEEIVPPVRKEGRFVTFQNGNMYWSPASGAHAVKPDMMEAWGTDGYETGPAGFPTNDEVAIAGGAWQQFQYGVTTRDSKGATHLVKGEISKKYVQLGGPASKLGFPTSNEISINGGAFTQFEHGNIYWSPTTGAHVIYYGDIFNAWGQDGYEQGKYGYPTTDMTDIPAGGLTIDFQHGTIKQVNGRIQKS